MGLTSIVASHDLEETFRVADQVIILGAGGVAAQGTPAEVMRQHRSAGAAIRPCPAHRAVPFPLPAAQFWRRTSGRAAMNFLHAWLAAPWAQLAALGRRTRLFGQLLGCCPPPWRGFGLVGEQIHFLGNYSLAIIGGLGPVCGVCAGLAGLLHLAALWLGRGAGPAGGADACCASWGRWSRPCCLPAALVRL